MTSLQNQDLKRHFRNIIGSLIFVLIFSWICSLPFSLVYTLSGITFFLWTTLVVHYGLIALFIFGMIWGGYWLHIHRTTIVLPNLPARFEGLKIVQISDTHLGTFGSTKFIERAVERINNEKPDVIFFTGDLVNNRAKEAIRFIEHLKRLSAPHGVFSILGNHDYGDYVKWPSAEAKDANLLELETIHRELGWSLLLNEHFVLKNDTDSIALIGVQNWGHAHNFPKYGDLKKATDGLVDTPIKLLLSHDPSHFNEIVIKEWKDIDLTLSGHTHGGQFGIELGSWKWSPVQYAYKKWAGLYSVGTQHLYVNRGLGMLGYSGRVGIWPEVTVLTLKSTN